MENMKKVVWPNLPARGDSSAQDHAKTLPHHQNAFPTNNSNNGNNVQDKPLGWMKNVADNEHHLHNTTEAMELEIQKRVWDATTGRRLSRSRSKSKNIMERARSFERAAAEVANGGGSANSSRAPSRQGSSNNIPNQMRGRRRRSPSAGRQMQMADFWQNEVHQQNVSRPSSRAGRDRSVGRVDTTQWEANMAKAKDKSVPPKTPPPKRRQMKPPSPCGPRDEDPRSPSPPAPPPPPRNMSSRSKAAEESLMTFNTTNADLSEATIQTMSQEEKEQFVDQWVRQTSTQEARDELEQFAYEIAESVVSTMERSHSQQQVGKIPYHQILYVRVA